MAFLIDPDHFGCSSKLNYEETARYGRIGRNSATALADYSLIAGNPPLALSIDRLSRCATDWLVFAQIALNHVLADIEVGFATPEQVLIAYEFGPDAPDPADRGLAVAAFRAAVDGRELTLGKCHSSIGEGPTAVTIAVVGHVTSGAFTEMSSGTVLIERPIGYFKLHYMAEMGLDDRLIGFTRALAGVPSRTFLEKGWAALCDVSGHGLLGSLLSLAERASIDIRIIASPALAADPRVLSIPVGCLENPRTSYDDGRVTIDERAWPLVSVRETAGPIVGLCEGAGPFGDAFDTGRTCVIGTYARGTGRLSVSWRD